MRALAVCAWGKPEWPSPDPDNVTILKQSGDSMSNVIQFLESMGSNARLARMSPEAYAAAVAALDADVETKSALGTRRPEWLGELMDSRPTMYCVVFAPEKDKPETPEQDGEEEKPAEENPKGE